MERKYLPSKPGMIPRDEVVDMLKSGLNYPLITLVAGPGYGKTEAVAQFVRPLPHRVVWINLAPLDNNRIHFWHKAISALQHEFPALSATLLERGFPNAGSEFDRHLGLMAQTLAEGQESILVLDNFGVLKDGPVRTFLEALISVQLAKLCIILISTSPDDLDRARSLVGHDCLEIDAAQLRFSQREAELFYRVAGVEITEASLRTLLVQTEGWPLAMYLIRQQDANQAAGRLPSGASFYWLEIDRLFARGFFGSYPPPMQQLLVSFAFLPSFSLDMVRAIQPDRSETFAALLRGNVFIAYDYNGQTFTFHPMYQSFLRQSRHLVTDEALEHVHKVAGDWFFARGNYFEAIACYFHCPCYSEMSEAIRMILLTHANEMPAAYLLSYLKKLPGDFLLEHPEIRLSIALLHISQMELLQGRAILQALEAELEAQAAEGPARSQLLGEVYAMLADVAFMRGEAACFDYYPKAAALLPHGSQHHNKALMFAGNNNLLFIPGDPPESLAETVAHMMEAARYTERYMGGLGQGFEYLFAAEAAYAICDTAAAQDNCHRAIFRAMKAEQHDIILNAYFLQLRCDLYDGDYAGVHERFHAMDAYCAKHNLDKLAEIRDNAKGWLYLRLGTLDNVPRWIVEYDESWYAQLPVTVGRNKIGHACYLAIKRRYRECIAYLDEMERLYDEAALWTIRLHHYVIKAHCQREIGEPHAAVATLHRAYAMTHRNGVYMGIAEYTRWVEPLLLLAQAQTALAFDPHWLQRVREVTAKYTRGLAAVQREHGKETAEPPITVRLSRREREVLALLVNGSTRNEIAEALGISVNSVKTHLGGAYNKLGAANRADAIRLAIGMGIV